jgi:hypothetical protein
LVAIRERWRAPRGRRGHAERREASEPTSVDGVERGDILQRVMATHAALLGPTLPESAWS